MALEIALKIGNTCNRAANRRELGGVPATGSRQLRGPRVSTGSAFHEAVVGWPMFEERRVIALAGDSNSIPIAEAAW